MPSLHQAVTVHMAAPPERIWDLVSDVTRIGSYSPETFEAVWVEGATGPAVGAKFRGHVKRNGIGPVYWVSCTVTECEPGRTFAFGTVSAEKPLNVWRYEIVPAGDGARRHRVVQPGPTLGLRIYWALWGWSRGKVNRKGMQTTLERIKAEVESGPASGPG